MTTVLTLAVCPLCGRTVSGRSQGATDGALLDHSVAVHTAAGAYRAQESDR